MLYCDRNFPTKKALKEAVAKGDQVTVYAPEMHETAPKDGTAAVGGPHYPKPHTWYATVTIKDGLVVKVK